MSELAIEQGHLLDPAPAAGRSGLPDVSFIVATYNAAPFVRQAVESALAQTGAAIEVIVADDASTDGTAEIVEALARQDHRVVLIRRQTNAGPSAARNQAMGRARGRWLAILDGDDLVAPERSRRLLDLAAATSADIVADNFRRFSQECQTGGATMIRQGPEPYSFVVDTAGFLRANRAFGPSRFSLGAIKGMFRADFLKAHGVSHREGLDFGEDFLLLFKCLLADARFVVTSESYYKYRMHPASQSWRMKPAHLEQLRTMIAEEALGERFGRGSEIAAAAQSYINSFERAAGFVAAVEAAKQRQIAKSLAMVARQPSLWPLIVRFGAQALGKRMKRRLAG